MAQEGTNSILCQACGQSQLVGSNFCANCGKSMTLNTATSVVKLDPKSDGNDMKESLVANAADPIPQQIHPVVMNPVNQQQSLQVVTVQSQRKVCSGSNCRNIASYTCSKCGNVICGPHARRLKGYNVIRCIWCQNNIARQQAMANVQARNNCRMTYWAIRLIILVIGMSAINFIL